MAFTKPGTDVLLLRNPSSGKHDLQWDSTGNPVFSDDESHRVASLIVEHRGKWWADPDGTRGSRINEVKEIRKASPAQLKNYALEACQKAVDEGKIQADPTVTVTRPSPTRIDLRVDYRTAGGKPGSATKSIST
jgi:phage gp46-like protein